MVDYLVSRGAVRPPFIEAAVKGSPVASGQKSRGAVRPPFIEAVKLGASEA